jgi:hypothetical protein
MLLSWCVERNVGLPMIDDGGPEREELSENPASSSPEPAPTSWSAAPRQQPSGDAQPQPPLRNRTAPVLIGVVAVIGVGLLVCVALSVWFLTQVGPQLQGSARDYTATQVAAHIQADGGTYTLSAGDIEQGINEQIKREGDATFDNVLVTMTPQGFEVRLDLQEQDVYYTGSFTVAEGRVHVSAADAEAPVVSYIFSANDMAQAIEDGINDYFASLGRRVVSVEQREGSVRFVTESAG